MDTRGLLVEVEDLLPALKREIELLLEVAGEAFTSVFELPKDKERRRTKDSANER